MIRNLLATTAATALITTPAYADVRPQAGKVYENIVSNGSYKFLESKKGDANRVTVRNAKLTVSRIGFQINTLVKGFVLDRVTVAATKVNKGGDFPAGLVVGAGSGPSEVTVSDAEFSGFTMDQVPDKYTNGDGVDCSTRTASLRISRTYLHDNSDGGLDTKCITVADDLTAARNYRNFRIWGQFTGTKLTSVDPRNAHVWISGGAAQVVTIDRLVVKNTVNTASVLFIASELPVTVLVKACEVAVLPGTLLQSGGKNARVTWGPTCLRDAKGYAINTAIMPAKAATAPAAPVPQIVDAGQLLPDGKPDGLIKLGAKWAKVLGLKPNTIVRHLDGYRYQVVR
ncbi:hypothetical protein ASE69_20810 [Sphingomonas sp. Leaf208]|uniref:hypothetical protein n=1 Tax=Sphingomonas sp. Leaf208 TaxID=1735679 RepID=UPI0006F98CDC|nr:hypothetical protein [Sphingomonas sp. Leaf208]KQM50356.1 hypothetical protein ASE69_20810 [Sphingomonas sp. Leaf208]